MKTKENNNLFDKITPLIIAENTLVKREMTLDEHRLVHEVSDKWINWIKENCKK